MSYLRATLSLSLAYTVKYRPTGDAFDLAAIQFDVSLSLIA